MAPSSRLQSPLLIQSIVGSLSCRSLIAALNSYDSKWRHVDTNYEQKLHLYSPLIVFIFRYVGKPIRECRSAFCNVVSERKLSQVDFEDSPNPKAVCSIESWAPSIATLYCCTKIIHVNHNSWKLRDTDHKLYLSMFLRWSVRTSRIRDISTV